MLTPQHYRELVDFILAASCEQDDSPEAIDRSTRRMAAAFPGLTMREAKRACAEAKSRLVDRLKQEFAEAKVDFPADLERILLADVTSLTTH
jgi:hypothetical protein